MLDATRASVRRMLVRRPGRSVTILSAVLVAVLFQAITMARNNYSLWRLEFTALEVGVALLASFAAELVRGLDERGEAWAATYVSADTPLYGLLRVLPAVAVRAALITACLAVVNATVVPMVIYRETVELPVLAVPVRFLADIPQGFVACLAVRLLVDGLSAAAQE